MEFSQIKSRVDPPAATGTDVTDAATINALADPTRFAILSAIAWGGARTVREVADRIGRRPGSLYRHFDVLEGLGLIARAGTVETARRDARLYEADSDIRFVYDADDPDVIDAINNLVASAARNAARSFARAARAGPVTRGPLRNTLMVTKSGWLNDEELESYNRKLDDLRDFLMSCERRPGTRLIHTTMIVSPGSSRAVDRDPTTHGDSHGPASAPRSLQEGFSNE